MSRDHRKLRVFADAHQLVLLIYKRTRNFPRDEWYALRLQMRKAAVSIPTNIVEGNARRTTKEYVNFLNISCGSSAELTYSLRVGPHPHTLSLGASLRSRLPRAAGAS